MWSAIVQFSRLHQFYIVCINEETNLIGNQHWWMQLFDGVVLCFATTSPVDLSIGGDTNLGFLVLEVPVEKWKNMLLRQCIISLVHVSKRSVMG